MLAYAILLSVVLPAVSAPTWCYVCSWIALACKVLTFLGGIYNAGKNT